MRVGKFSSTNSVGTKPSEELLVTAILSNLLVYANFMYLGLLRDRANYVSRRTKCSYTISDTVLIK